MASNADIYLAPLPKKVTFLQGTFDPKGKRYILLQGEDIQSMLPAVRKAGFPWEMTASPLAPKQEVGLIIRVDEESGIPDEGYKLSVRPSRIEITASTPSGAFYGACTLRQLSRQSETTGSKRGVPRLPCLSITDAPDFAERGVMLDVSRDKVPSMETLYHLIDLLAEWKINQFQLYTEHTFAYLGHPEVWKNADPLTGEQIIALDAYCRERFIELVPNQNCFGHMTRWLTLDKYRPMAEAPNGCDTAWGYFEDPFSLCPGDRRTLPFVKSLFDELLPHFSSRMFNVGLDETVDLGRGRSKKVCEERGTGRVYLDFLLKIYDLVTAHGRTMQFWGDIIIKHPDLIPELPKDCIALEWGYEADHPFEEHGAKFAESGIPFYVCPGTSSWNTLCGRTDNAIGNLTSAAKNGLKQEAIGYLNTDWGDYGHWQPLSVSYLGFMAGAMASWNAKADVGSNLAENLSVNAFGDTTGKVGRAFYDLGNIYRVFAKKTFNSSVPWQMLFRPLDDPKWVEGVDMREFVEMDERLREIEESVRGEKMSCPDARIVREEIKHLFKLLRFSSEVGKMRLGGPKPKNLSAKVQSVKESHQNVWLLRNRPGGLKDSLGKIKVG